MLALADYATSPLYTEAERVALEYADTITLSDRDVGDELFARVRRFYDDDAVVELTEIIAWENASSKFNRALRIPSQGAGDYLPAGRRDDGPRHPDTAPATPFGMNRIESTRSAPNTGWTRLRETMPAMSGQN